ncbi:MAG: hypothetical protein CFE34_08305 [Rhodobacteraceae bacterium PARR1]|nr:MAG: hypothetical protein CFE34_08305 [Rhodobacteraceae bacterium PARR1]
MQDRDRTVSEPGFDDLDALFGAARARPAVPSDALMARVMADALDLQPAPRVLAAPPPAPPGLWRGVIDFFGGFGALAGMGSAAAAGLFLGFVQPTGVADLSAALIGGQIDSLSLMPSVDDLITEVTP